MTERESYPLPQIEDVLGRLTGARYFSSLDLESGLANGRSGRASVKNSVCNTGWPLRIPFGLCGSFPPPPPSFQLLMDRVLDGLKLTKCLCYMDDILLFGSTFPEHQSRLDKILGKTLGKANLVLNSLISVNRAQRIVH